MTTLAAFNKLQKLLWSGVRKKNISGIRTIENSAYIDPAHIMTIEAFNNPESPITYYDCNGEYSFNLESIANRDPKNMVAIPTDYLKEVLAAIDSDSIRLYWDNPSFLKICGDCDDIHIIARIAPRIDPEYVDYSDTDVSPVLQQKNAPIPAGSESIPAVV